MLRGLAAGDSRAAGPNPQVRERTATKEAHLRSDPPSCSPAEAEWAGGVKAGQRGSHERIEDLVGGSRLPGDEVWGWEGLRNTVDFEGKGVLTF